MRRQNGLQASNFGTLLDMLGFSRRDVGCTNGVFILKTDAVKLSTAGAEPALILELRTQSPPHHARTRTSFPWPFQAQAGAIGRDSARLPFLRGAKGQGHRGRLTSRSEITLTHSSSGKTTQRCNLPSAGLLRTRR